MLYAALFLALNLCCFVAASRAQTPEQPMIPRIDKRVEFLTIAYHLAKSGAVPDSVNTNYARAINKHFAPYREHQFLRHFRAAIDSLETINGNISAWEIPSLAVHLSPMPRCSSLVRFDAPLEVLDGWDNRALLTPETVKLLNQFYDEARAEDFFAAQMPYYKRIEAHYRKNHSALQPRWVRDFFGTKPTEEHFPILALGIREGSYLRVNFDKSRRHTATIYAAETFDQNGFPTRLNDTMITQLMLHEVIHCYANHLADMDSTALKPHAVRLLAIPAVFEKMKNTFYGNPQYLVYESLVRAVSIRYNMQSKEFRGMVEKNFAQQDKAGFFWMRDVVGLLGEYERNRKQYPSFDTFLPRFRALFGEIASKATK